MTEEEKVLAPFMEKLKREVVAKYHHYLAGIKNEHCVELGKTVGSSGKIVCHANWFSFKRACEEMEKDILFLVKRRGKLMSPLKPSFGKIAGVIAYRLAKCQIIHLCEGCAGCNKQESCFAPRLNAILALKCAWTYIDVQYYRVPEEIRTELFYSFMYRHVNQETLGLVFDAAYRACHTAKL